MSRLKRTLRKPNFSGERVKRQGSTHTRLTSCPRRPLHHLCTRGWQPQLTRFLAWTGPKPHFYTRRATNTQKRNSGE